MKNDDLMNEIYAQLDCIPKDSVFNEKKLDNALKKKVFNEKKLRSIRDALNIILECECFESKEKHVNKDIVTDISEDIFIPNHYTPKQNAKLMKGLRQALGRE